MTGRLRGYRKAMEATGLEPMLLHLHVLGLGPGSIQFEQEFQQALTGPDRPTAVLTYNEPIALRCFRLMVDRGISFADVALLSIGWQYTPVLQLAGVSMLELPARRMGKVAYNMLLEKIETGKSHPTVSLQGKIVESASTRR